MATETRRATWGKRDARRRLWRAGGAVAEELERRTLLTATLSAFIPAHIDPNTVTPQQEQLFPQGTTNLSLGTPPPLVFGNGPFQQFYRFALNNVQEGQTTTFSTSAALPGIDTALALYDSDGNLLQKADADQPSPTSESLSAVLPSGRKFELGVFDETLTSKVATAFTLSAVVPPQVQNTTLKIDPATGQLKFQANSGNDRFNSPTDVDSYPLDFTNGGASGTVTLNSSSPDTRFFADIFAQVSPGNWQQVSSGSGAGPVTLNVTPAAGGELTNGQYVLAVSPQNFNSPAEPYEVDLSAPVLGPASVSGQTLSSPLALAPTASGTAGASVTQAFSAAGLFPFQAVDNGPVTVTLNASSPLLSIYDSTGNNLLGVAANPAAGSTQVSVTVQATKGQQFLARAGAASGSFGGQMTLAASQGYAPTALTATAIVQQQSHLAVAPATGGQFFRITPPAGANYLMLELAPDSGATLAPHIVAVASGLGVVQSSTAAGQPVTLPIDLSQASGPIDVYLIGTSGAGTATLSFGGLNVPQQVPLGQFATQPLDVKTAGLTAIVPVPAAGQLAGIQFYELSPGQSETFTAQSSSGTPLLLLRFVQSGGVLQLDDRALVSGSSAATLTGNLQGTLMYAIAALPLGAATGTIQLQATSPTVPQGVGVSMAPNKIALPNQPPPTAPFVSELKLIDQIIASPQQRDLFATILPFNMTASPTLTFKPSTIGGPLAVTITLLDANNNTLNTFTTTAGQAFTSPALTSLTATNAGQTVRLLVEPLAGHALGDGTYTLQMDVPTSDPNPFLATEPSVKFFNLLPTVTAIPFGSSTTGTFSSSAATTQFYSVLLPNTTTPFKIWTEDLDGTVNTDMKIYRLSTVSTVFPRSRTFTFSEFDNEPPPSFDYFPANRSQVDAQVTVNNYHILDGEFTGNFAGNANTIYIAVKNEQGSQGQYRIHAEAVHEPDAGPGRPNPTISFGGLTTQLIIDPNNGVGTIVANASVLGNEVVLLNTPHGLTNGPITLKVTAATGSDVQIHLYDASHTVILQEDALPNSSHVATFALPQLAPASGYTLGIFALDDQPVNNVTLNCSVSTSSSQIQPDTTDTLAGGTTDPYTRVVPTPGGSFSDSKNLTLNNTQSETLDKLAFYVTNAGPAHFSYKESGLFINLVSLYREDQTGGEFISVSGNLLDFVTPQADGTASFDAYLTPGLYVLKVVGDVFVLFNQPVNVSFSIAAATPAYDAKQITLDPTTAQNDQVNLQTIDDTFNFFSTEYYEVTAPGGVSGPFMLDLHNIQNATTGVFDVGVFKKTGATYTSVGSTSINLAASPTPTSVMLQTTDLPVPGDQYFISVNRDLAATVTSGIQLSLGPSFMIPQPGLPDLIPQIQLSPDNGKTRVLVTIRDFGFGAAGASHGLLNFSNYPTPSDITFSGVGPFGTISYIADWLPGAPSNTVSFTADSTNVVGESNETNNSTSVALSTVDPFAPTSSFALSDPSLNAEGTTWGRYVSGVHGVTNHIQLTGTGNSIYEELITGGPLFDEFIATGGAFPTTHTLDLPFDFGDFQPTSPASPNIIQLSVIDPFGLKAPDLTQKVDVVPKSQFLTSITFDPQAKKYDLAFVHDVVNEQETLSQLFGFDVPVVGDKNNQFLVHVEAKGTASLDPTQTVSLPLTGHILLEALGQSLYDESFDGSSKLTDHLTFTTRLDIDRHSLDPTAASASLQLQNLQLLHFVSPSIKLFSFGLPDVASVDGSIKFGLDASLSAGVKLGIDPNILIDPLSLPDRFGVMSPTFIHPTITGTATAEGSVEVLGFDVASLSGTVALTLDATVGLDNNDPAKVFSFDDFFNHIAIKVGGDLKVNLKAHVAIIGDIWSFDKDFPFTLLNTTTQGIITQDPTASGTPALTVGQLQSVLSNPLSVLAGGIAPLDVPAPDVKHGTDLVGAYAIDPHPVIVIDPVTGRALTLQVVNASQTPGQTLGNLSFAQRNGGNWSAPTVLPGNDAAEPNLALTHDSAASTAAAVVVYEATNVPGSPASLTLNQKLDDTDIRFRYFNGSGFGAEQSITSDGLLDGSPSVAFNASGKGVVAWVHNTNATAMAADGNYSRNTQDIEAAIWNSTTHTFGAPLAVSVAGDGTADYSPATYVDDSGKMYAVWISGADDNNALMYSTSTGGAWSPPQQLPITGLMPGGSFKDLSIGRDKLGRINVIFSYRDPIAADGSVHTLLLDRATTAAGYAQPTGFEQITHDANYSNIQTTNAPDGSLVAYWQKGDGVDNGVFYSSLTRSSASPSAPWTVPMRLTSTTDLTMTPSLAVDPLNGGNMDLLFHQAVPDGGQPAPPSPDPQVGVTLASGVGSSSLKQLPELTFSNGLFFPNQDMAAAGGSATGDATILNRGPVAAQVTIDSFVGLPAGGTLINTQQITLGPGSTYNYSQLFPISAGSQTYSVRVTSATGEAVTTDDDISAATLTGLPDITIASFGPSAAPQPGQPFTLTADVKNLSNAPIGAFDVTLYSGDPHFPQIPGAPIATQHVTGLGASADLMLNFPMTASSTAGDFLFTAVADSGNVIQEAVETNNSASFEYRFSAEPAITSVSAAPASGGSNVTITVNVSNSGNVGVVNVPVHLQVSIDGGDFTDLDTQNVSIGANQTGQLTFQETAHAGDDTFRAMFDESVDAFDSDITDNVGQTELSIRGLADLSVGTITLGNTRPQQGDALKVTAAIQNSGIADAGNVLVEVFALPTIPTGSSAIALGSTRIDQVPAGGQASATLTVDTSSLVPGTYTLLVQVNRLQDVLESNTQNNTASVPLTVIAKITPNNAVTGTAGTANTITLRRDPNGTEDDIWVNTAVTAAPTQVALLSNPITITGGGLLDTLVVDTSAGDPLPAQLTLSGNFSTGALSVNAGEIVTLASTASAGTNKLTLTSLGLDPAGKLETGNGTVQINYTGATPLSRIQGYLKAGQIKSSLAGNGLTINDVDTRSAIKLTFGLAGDTNGDGKVNFADLVALAASYGKSGQDSAHGDTNYDGQVNFADLVALAANYGKSAPAEQQQPDSTLPALAGPLLKWTDAHRTALARRH